MKETMSLLKPMTSTSFKNNPEISLQSNYFLTGD